MLKYFNWVSSDDFWLVWLILAILFMAGLVLLVVLSYRLQYILLDRKKKKFKSTLIVLLSNVLNKPESALKYTSRIEYLLNKRWKYEILLDQLITVCYSFQGVYADRARALFDEFNLIERSKEKLSSTRWDEVVEGIIELSVIAEHDGLKLIHPLLYHPNEYVRREAKIAMVEIGKVDGLVEMNSQMGVMSQWTFISILSILHRNPYKLPEKKLKLLSESKNPSMRKLSTFLGKYSIAYN